MPQSIAFLKLVLILLVCLLLSKLSPIYASTVFSDSFSNSYSGSWQVDPSTLSPIRTAHGIGAASSSQWSDILLPVSQNIVYNVQFDLIINIDNVNSAFRTYVKDSSLSLWKIVNNWGPNNQLQISERYYGGLLTDWSHDKRLHHFEIIFPPESNSYITVKENGVEKGRWLSNTNFNIAYIGLGLLGYGDYEMVNFVLSSDAYTPPPCQWDGNILSTDPLCKQCQYNPNIIESNPNCVPPCQWDRNISSTDPLCKQCRYNPNIIESDPKCAPPITKVVLIPGFGGSWNADAILNCKSDNYRGEWTSWNLGDQVYSPIITSINASNYVAKPFYYDWRKQIPDAVPLLSNFISQNVIPREQIYMVGHSMGGLLGLEYIRGLTINNVVNKFLMAGSPHEGVLDAYPAWVGGDVGGDLFRKMSSYIALKNCHGNGLTDKEAIQKYIPSVQNILPIFNYIKDKKTGQVKPIASMHVTNNFLKEPLFTNTTLKTLSGIRETTLRYFDVNRPNNSWPDGKPEKKEYDIGDGTVLADSSVLTKYNVPNTYIQQDHLGLMSAQESISEIFQFLFGTVQASTVNIPTYTTPKSSLVVIADPASFWILDPDKKLQEGKNSISGFLNPKPGSYRLIIVPKSQSTRIIIAQFLENGQIFWKEYKHEGRGPKIATITFDPQNPQEDAMK